MTKEDVKKLSAISQAIFDKKGFNILVLDVRHISTMGEYCIIAEGSVDRHVKSLCGAIKDQLASLDLSLYHIDGERDGDWIVMDAGVVIIHLFIPDMREKYALEEMWKKAKIVDVKIVTGEK